MVDGLPSSIYPAPQACHTRHLSYEAWRFKHRATPRPTPTTATVIPIPESDCHRSCNCCRDAMLRQESRNIATGKYPVQNLRDEVTEDHVSD